MTETRTTRAGQDSNSRRMRFLHSRWQALMLALIATSISLAAYWFHPALIENLDQRNRLDMVPHWPEVEMVQVAFAGADHAWSLH